MKAVLRLLWPFTKGRRTAFLGGLSGTLLVTVAELARPFPLKLVLDRLLGAGSRGAGADARLIGGVALLVIAIAAFGAVGTYLAESGMRRAGEHVVHDLRVALYRHLQRLSLRYHRRHHHGDLVTRITGDVHAVGELVAESLVKVIGALLLLAGMLAVSLALDPVLTLAAAGVTPLLVVATVRSQRTVKAAARRQRAAEGAIATLSTEALGAIGTVKALGSEAAEEERLRRRSQERRDAGMVGTTTEGRFGGLVDVLEAVGMALVLAVGVLRVNAGALSAGDLVVMYSYVRRLYRPLRDLSRQSGRVVRAMARAERIAEVLAADDTLPERAAAYAAGRATGHVELRNVRYLYPGRAPVLDGVRVDIPAGSTVAVVGPSGAGKSTLAALLGRFHDPDSGFVLLDGRDLRDCSLRWLRDQVGFVLQDTALFSGTVADNIAYATAAPRERIIAAARAAHADEFISALPDGYDTDLGPGGANLSGGQRQRLAIARALLRDPAVVVLDEPTSGLDAASESIVMTSLHRLCRDRTTVLITHSMRLARRADRVVVLDAGHVIEEGTPSELLARQGPFRRLATEQGLVAPPALPVPADAALTGLGALLDVDAVAEVLAPLLHDPSALQDVTVRYVRYKPATNAVVDYDVHTHTGTYRAVLMVAADRDLAKRAARPTARVLAAKVDGRTPVRSPLTYSPHLRTLIQWLPLDLWLPALATEPDVLASAAGITIGEDGFELLGYKPRRRAVLRGDGHVLKLYADEDAFRAAATALLAGPRMPVPTAPPAGVDRSLRLTVQRVVEGNPLDDPTGAGAEAGALLATLHRANISTAHRTLDPLGGAVASAATVAALIPALARRVERLTAGLSSGAPPPGTTTVCHGDFHAGQLVATAHGVAVVDFDESGIGAPAFDLATFAAHTHDGTDRGRQRVDATIEVLVAGYGAAPEHLDWHTSAALVRRAVFPFRTQPSPDWPQRVETMIATAESVLDR